jgi:hypothetical protein
MAAPTSAAAATAATLRSVQLTRLLVLLLFCLQYTWPEFIGADLSKVTLIDALGKSSWDSSRR